MAKEKIEEEDTEEDIEESTERRYVIEDIPTATTPVILDKEADKRYDLLGSIMLILEELNEIKKLAS